MKPRRPPVSRETARREVQITLAGVARIFLAATVGAFAEALLAPPIRWGLLGLAVAFGGGALWMEHKKRRVVVNGTKTD